MTDLPVPGAARRTPYPVRNGGSDVGGSAEFGAWMQECLSLASECVAVGDVPIGAVVVDRAGDVVGRGRNVRVEHGDPTGHAEVVALRDAARALGSWRLDGCTLVVTLEPCAMCAGALVQSRIERVVFGAWDDKAGACGSVWDLVRDPRALHRAEVIGGVEEARCVDVLTDFFRSRR